MYKAILEGHKVVLVDDVIEWGRWFEKAKRTVRQEELPNGKWVSTVFLGIDYNMGMKGKPLWFETMVFESKDKLNELDLDRYTTWGEAEKGHSKMVNRWINR